MTDHDFRELVATLGVRLTEAQQETSRFFQKSREENDRRQQETDRHIRELKQQLGGLGDKFGSFTEGLALPSMEKILGQRFGMDVVAPRVRARRNGHSMEVDVLAYSHSNDQVFVVEVKSHLREEALDQLRRILKEFREFFPEHKDKKLFGILAAVDAPDRVRDKALREGFYLARIHDGQFELQVPDGFQPHAF
jgi:hypothetical protein